MMRTSKSNATHDWEGSGLPEAPSAPESLKEAGLGLGFVNDLILRVLYTRGGMLGENKHQGGMAGHVSMSLLFDVLIDAVHARLKSLATVLWPPRLYCVRLHRRFVHASRQSDLYTGVPQLLPLHSVRPDSELL